MANKDSLSDVIFSVSKIFANLSEIIDEVILLKSKRWQREIIVEGTL